ncbi:MAG: hypothetical protein LC101_09825 [Flavobacteriales bacterium]|nr:hypothetical protein [Flavobacteriales bacterium]MCZ2444057.1 hypothetical protein [Flavobacteriales bacterium]
MRNFWNRDHLGFGVLLGAFVPIVTYLILESIDRTVMQIWHLPFFLLDDTQFALAVAGNLFFFRQFMVKKHKDRTGRGILLSTFVYAFLYVLLFFLLDIKYIFPL